MSVPRNLRPVQLLVAVAPFALLVAGTTLATSSPSAWYAACALVAISSSVLAWRKKLHERGQWHTAANLISALRQEDYSLRVRPNALGTSEQFLFQEVNALGEQLRHKRLEATEASELLQRVVTATDTAMLAFDESMLVVLDNRAARQLFGVSDEGLLGCSAADLGLPLPASDKSPQKLSREFPGALGPFELRSRWFRYRGRPHTLAIMVDVGKLLGGQERRAHRQMIHAFSHELNNSLAPIQSLAMRLQSVSSELGDRVAHRPTENAGIRETLQEGLDDLRLGLSVIHRRAHHLGRVMGEYAKLAKIPEPVKKPLSARRWLQRIEVLHDAQAVVVDDSGAVDPQGEVFVYGDEGLLDQALLNLIKNGIEANQAVHEKRSAVVVRCTCRDHWVVITVTDNGSGIDEETDPFLPLFTTKDNGAGIGLPLSRDILMAHDGRLELRNRTDAPGAVARLTLPRY